MTRNVTAGVEDAPPTRRRVIETWETVAVTALPDGWRNVYAIEDAPRLEVPCPAIMLQELRMIEWMVDDGDGQIRTERREVREAPFETRAMFAEEDDGELTPAREADNYVRTVGPGEESR